MVDRVDDSLRPQAGAHPHRHGHGVGAVTSPCAGGAGRGRRVRGKAIRPGRAVGAYRGPGHGRPRLSSGRSRSGWPHAHSCQFLSQGQILGCVGLEEERVNRGLVGSGLTELCMGCEEADLDVRSHLFEPWRRFDAGQGSGQSVVEHNDPQLRRSRHLEGPVGAGRHTSDGETVIHREDRLDEELNVRVVLDDNEDLHRRHPHPLEWWQKLGTLASSKTTGQLMFRRKQTGRPMVRRVGVHRVGAPRIVGVTPELLVLAIRTALGDGVDEGELAVDVPEEVRIERTRNRDHGDWSTNIALQIAKDAGMPPRQVAAALAARLDAVSGVKAVDIAGPGFLNITLDAAAAGGLARTIVEAGTAYGRGDAEAGHRINVEFVSANPTGPIHLGSTRWAAVGDALARIFEFSGAEVTREYYFNDHGAQIDRFAASLLAAAKGDPAPEDGYAGAYINDIASAVIEREPGILDLPDPTAQERFRAVGVDLMFAEIKATLHDFGVEFDVYFHENTLHETGAVQRAVARLTELGVMYEKDGATWLRTTDYGDDKDRVVIKSDGQPAYISGDLAYYLNKRERGFDRAFIMLGADHHGYVSRMMAMCAAFGDTPHENLEILIGQMVN